MEPVVAHAALRDAGVVRRLDRAPERARVAEPGVVDENEQDVRRAPRGRGVTDEIPIGLRPVERSATVPEKVGRRIGRWLRSTSLIPVSSLRSGSPAGASRRSVTDVPRPAYDNRRRRRWLWRHPFGMIPAAF